MLKSLSHLLRPRRDPASKPVETLLCAIARDEDPYIAEWVEFHLALGFQRIVIYDNESRRPVLSCVPPSAAKRVEVRRWPTPAHASPQIPAYADALRRRSSEVDWMMFLDLDEFLNLKRHGSVAEFVAGYADADGIAVNWRMFGSSGEHVYDGRPVLRRFTRASRETWTGNYHVKTLFRPDSVLHPGVHSPRFHEGARLVDTCGRTLDGSPNGLQKAIDLRVAQVNHYFTKSRSEFELKLARGRADVLEGSPEKYRDAGAFSAYDRNEDEDRTILRHLEARGRVTG